MATDEKAVSKKKQSRIIRNVLCQPFSTPWPSINEEEAQLLIPALKSVLSPMRIQKLKAPWKDLCKLKKEERKEKTIEFLNSIPKEQKELHNEALKLRDFLFFGINAVSRGVENKLVQFSLVADEVIPKILVKHLIQLLHNAGIPVLLVPNLKTVTNDSIGFPCAAVGFKKIEGSDKNRFSEFESEFMKLFSTKKVTNIEENAIHGSSEDYDDILQAKISKLYNREEKNSPCIKLINSTKETDKKRKGLTTTNPSTLQQMKSAKLLVENALVKNSKNGKYLPPLVKKVQSNPCKKRKTKK